ncbi:MAG: transcription antitermination protein NusB [Bacteroidales bacterium]|jgi:N utilization substance protein B
MLSRRFIRIKIFKVLFSCVHSQNFDLASAENELIRSLDKTRQLYFLLLSLPGSLVRYAQERIDIGMQKYRPSEKETNPNLRFVTNKAIGILNSDKELTDSCTHGLNWTANRSYIIQLYDSLKEEPYFLDYMNAPEEPGFQDDLQFLMDFYGSQLDDDPELYSILEDRSLHWTDDVAYICNIILTQLSGLRTEHDKLKHPPLFYNDDDKNFATRLFNHSLEHYPEYMSYIEKFAQNWDLERIAATDTILIVMGVAEAVAFPQIPIKVTLNEMVEISKFYSTENSKMFVNGILDRIIKFLTAEGKIEKRGRGLVEK